MLDPEYLYYVTDNAVELADRLETEILIAIIQRILMRIKRGEKYILTASDKWRIEILEESGLLLEDVSKIIAKYTNLTQKEIIDAMLDAEVEALSWDEKVYAKAGLTKYEDKDLPTMTKEIKDKYNITDEEARRRARRIIKRSPYVARVNERMLRATMGTFHNMTRTVAFNSVKKYVDITDQAYTDVVSGAKSYTQSIKESVDKLSKEGIKLRNAAGKEESIESAVLRNVRTAVGQTTAQITLERMKEMEIDLVMVSSHLGARPSHYKWQGGIYHVDWDSIS